VPGGPRRHAVWVTGTPEWFETFLDLHAVSRVEDLWDVLVSWHGIRSSTQWHEAYALFRRFHAEEPAGAVVTAALLCTDTRWRKASHHLVERIAGSGRLTGAAQQQLAEWFVAPSFDVEVGVEVREPDRPESPTAERAGGGEERRRRMTVAVAEVHAVERPIWPPLRRWAAAHLVADDPNRWRGLLVDAAAMPSRDAAALAAGIMDAAEHIPPSERSEVVAAGLGSGSGVVRLAALPALAALEGPEAALARAAADSSVKVRAWTPVPPPAGSGHLDVAVTADEGTVPPRSTARGQASLF